MMFVSNSETTNFYQKLLRKLKSHRKKTSLHTEWGWMEKKGRLLAHKYSCYYLYYSQKRSRKRTNPLMDRQSMSILIPQTAIAKDYLLLLRLQRAAGFIHVSGSSK